jgi:hypothetical protein
MSSDSETWTMTASPSIWLNLEIQLQAQRQAIIEQIRAYPPPIPACDAQFNYLLEQRDLLSAERNRLLALGESASLEALRDFVRTSAVVDSASIP